MLLAWESNLRYQYGQSIYHARLDFLWENAFGRALLREVLFLALGLFFLSSKLSTVGGIGWEFSTPLPVGGGPPVVHPRCNRGRDCL